MSKTNEPRKHRRFCIFSRATLRHAFLQEKLDGELKDLQSAFQYLRTGQQTTRAKMQVATERYVASQSAD